MNNLFLWNAAMNVQKSGLEESIRKVLKQEISGNIGQGVVDAINNNPGIISNALSGAISSDIKVAAEASKKESEETRKMLTTKTDEIKTNTDELITKLNTVNKQIEKYNSSFVQQMLDINVKLEAIPKISENIKEIEALGQSTNELAKSHEHNIGLLSTKQGELMEKIDKLGSDNGSSTERPTQDGGVNDGVNTAQQSGVQQSISDTQQNGFMRGLAGWVTGGTSRQEQPARTNEGTNNDTQMQPGHDGGVVIAQTARSTEQPARTNEGTNNDTQSQPGHNGGVVIAQTAGSTARPAQPNFNATLTINTEFMKKLKSNDPTNAHMKNTYLKKMGFSENNAKDNIFNFGKFITGNVGISTIDRGDVGMFVNYMANIKPVMVKIGEKEVDLKKTIAWERFIAKLNIGDLKTYFNGTLHYSNQDIFFPKIGKLMFMMFDHYGVGLVNGEQYIGKKIPPDPVSNMFMWL